MFWVFKILKNFFLKLYQNDTIKAFNIVTCPDGIGRFFVLSTLASYFLSKISFQVHPAPRIKNAPNPHAINNHIS